MIMYGIDILEEMVYFLNFMVCSFKLVIVVGVMCLVNEIFVDGLVNLINVVWVGLEFKVVGSGVMVVLNEWISVVCEVWKIYNRGVDIF